MNIQLEIPLQAYLFQYLKKELGQPYVLTKQNAIARVLLAHVTRPESITPIKRKETDLVLFKVTLREHLWSKIGVNTITTENEKQFILYVKERFYKELAIWVDSRMSLKNFDKKRIQPSAIKKNDAVIEFCNYYNINFEDVSMDTLLKALQRRKKLGRHR